jgi:hypothetical protein
MRVWLLVSVCLFGINVDTKHSFAITQRSVHLTGFLNNLLVNTNSSGSVLLLIPYQDLISGERKMIKKTKMSRRHLAPSEDRKSKWVTNSMLVLLNKVDRLNKFNVI